MFSVLKISIFLLLTLQLVQCQRRSNKCKKQGESGICLPLEQCPGLYNDIQFMPKPYGIEITRHLEQFTCKNRTDTICCINRYLNPDELNITSHTNINLLPNITMCGIPTVLTLNRPGYTKRLEYPFMVILIYGIEGEQKKISACGGSIINNRYVLTAAHCLYMNTTLNLEFVRVGAHNLRSSTRCNPSNDDETDNCEYQSIDIPIKEKIPHPDYVPNKSKNDIALIRLQNRMDFSKNNIKPICLPVSEHLQKRSLSNFIDVGWGSTISTEFASHNLKASSLPVKSNDVCKRRYPDEELEEKQLCAVGNTCHVDSGGPAIELMIMQNHLRYVQFGISTSTVLNCHSDEEVPVIYTRVSQYVLWILSKIKQ